MKYKDRHGQPLKATDHGLDLANCPWCGVASPTIVKGEKKAASAPSANRTLGLYWCRSCAHGILVECRGDDTVTAIRPEPPAVDEAIPARAAHFLREALGTRGSPSACIVMAASAVDAMLKARGLKDGPLNSRIVQGLKQGILTTDMQAWADHVRLDANLQRHADEDATLPTADEAADSVEFAMALAQYLFVLPARVKHFRKPGS